MGQKQKFDESYRRIFGNGKRVTGTFVMHNGKLVRARGGLESLRAHDSKNMVSIAAGVQSEQIAQSTREITKAGMGSDMKYRKDGNVIWKDRPAKLRCMKKMGLVDFNEVRG